MRYNAKHGITIMLVDTNEKFLQYFQDFLKENLSWNVIVEQNGAKAILKAETTPVHLFLMETKLTPTCNGFRTLELIRGNEKIAKTPVCFVTAMRDKGTLAKAWSAGVDGYFKKPIVSEEILKAVIEHITKTVKFKILIVDSDEKIFPELKRLLCLKFPYKIEIFTAESAFEGLNILDSQEINLLIVGNNMSTISGVRMIAMVKDKEGYADIPVVFIPDELSAEERYQIVELGIEHFIEKPFKPNEPIEVMMTALNVPPVPMFDDDVIQID